VRYTKSGPLRFSSHRDLARALERALRRAEVPVAVSAGFSPHPRISYVGACPTGVASEAEYLELGLHTACDPDRVRAALDEALPASVHIAEVVEAAGESLPDRIDASTWAMTFSGSTAADLQAAVAALLAAEAVPVLRKMKDGLREIDARAAVVAATTDGQLLTATLRHLQPTVRPDDVLSALKAVGLPAEATLLATRLAQGKLDGSGQIVDPLAA
jgi:radical SAM-linked protein